MKVISARKDYVSTEEIRAHRLKLMLNLVFKYSKRRENLDGTSIVLRDRHKIKMKFPYSNKDRVLKSPSYMSIDLWNRLEEETQSIEAREEFKGNQHTA